MEHQSSPTPHVLIFPLPIQGHITPMLNLAELLCLANLKVTFLNTTQNHKLLTRNTNIEARFARYPGFVFSIVPDGLADEHPRAGVSKFKDWSSELVEKLALSGEPLLREMLEGSTGIDKVTCLIIDGWISFANEVANEVKVPVIAFRCSSPCYMWTYFCIPKLIQAGDIPFKALGHLTPMLQLAELLCIANFKVTFLNTTQNHQRLTQHTDIEARFEQYPGFEFKTMPDGLSADNPRTGQADIKGLMMAAIESLSRSAEPLLRDILLGSSETAKITCLIYSRWVDEFCL